MRALILLAVIAIPAVQPAAGTFHYQSRLEVEGKPLSSVTVKIEIAQERGLWVVTETSKMPSGDVIETVEFDAVTHDLRKHSLMQGAMRMAAAIDDGKLTGWVTIGAERKDLATTIEKGVLPGGPALPVVLSQGRLIEDSQVAFRHFDLQTLTTVSRVARVEATEEIDVPAGRFQTTRVGVSAPGRSANYYTFWFAAPSRRIVRTMTRIPEADAVVINELVKEPQ